MAPLEIKDGLNPSRVPLPHTREPMEAVDFLRELILAQRHRHPEDGEDALLARFAAGEVVDDAGRALSPTDVIRPGRFINFYRRPAPEREVPGDLRLLHQDENLLVVDKPPFLATLPRGQHIVQTALVRARRQFGIPELSPAHRLDRLTRGVLMFTVRPEVRGAYQQLFDTRQPRKVYEARTPSASRAPFAPIARFSSWQDWDAPTPTSPWVLQHHMIKVRGRLSTYLVEDGGVAPNAETLVLGVRKEGEELVWTLLPLSGKTHQLRVVLRSLGLPIINDPLYEDLSDEALVDPEAALPRPPFADEEDFTVPMELTAKELSFTDPISGELRTFRSQY